MTYAHDLDMIVCQQELGPRPPVGQRSLTIDVKTSMTKDVTTHILTVIKSLFEKFLGYEEREISSLTPPVPTVSVLTPTTKLTFGSQLRARRVGEAELNNVLYPNHVTKCIHTVHRHKRCYKCCCYSSC